MDADSIGPISETRVDDKVSSNLKEGMLGKITPDSEEYAITP